MADDVTTLPAGQEELSLVPDRRDRARQSGYRLRFGLLYVLLAAVVGGGVGAFVILVTRDAPPEAAAWSSWRPTGSFEASAKQIADHVSKGYRLPSGKQLAVALVGPPEVQDVSVRAIAVMPDTSKGQAEEDDIDVIDAGNSVMYILCGLGQQCSIPEGEPTEERHQLLRREALELSLYSFKYLEDIESVIVFLPPRPDADVGSSVFLQRRDLREELRRPLNRTLTRAQPPELGRMDPIEAGNVDRLTLARVFEYEFQQSQDGSAVLVLSPVALGT